MNWPWYAVIDGPSSGYVLDGREVVAEVKRFSTHWGNAVIGCYQTKEAAEAAVREHLQAVARQT